MSDTENKRRNENFHAHLTILRFYGLFYLGFTDSKSKAVLSIHFKKNRLLKQSTH